LDTLQAAILLPKLDILDEEIEMRQAVARRYDELLGAEGIATPYIEAHNVSAWAQYTVRVPKRDAVQAALKQAGIPTAVHYPIPVNQQPAVAAPEARLPAGDTVAREVLSLPMHPSLNNDQAKTIATALGAAVRG